MRGHLEKAVDSFRLEPTPSGALKIAVKETGIDCSWHIIG